MKSIYDYFEEPFDVDPTYDPGYEVDCPVCHKKLEPPSWTISLLVEGDNRSYFFRMHRECRMTLTQAEADRYEHVLVDAVVKSKESN